MGAGKSTVGPIVAERLSLPFVDLDVAIERSAGASVAEIFVREGEGAFRARETGALEEILRGAPSVVALGGGTLHARPENRALLEGIPVVWLQVPFPVLEARLAALPSGTRPLSGRAKELYDTRRPDLARPDHVVDADAAPSVVADRVLEVLESP